jgi:thiamine biosynthesis lipoprotein
MIPALAKRIVSLLALGLVAFASEQTPSPEIATFSKTLMGAEVLILVDAEDSNALEEAVRSTYQEGERLNMIFSDYEANSEVSKLSQSSGSGNALLLSPELFELLKYAQNLSKMSEGAFDVTVGPLSRLWRIARFQKKLPDTNKITQALDRVGFQNLFLNEANRSALAQLSGMVIDLGAIAKGYIADRMLERMKKHGFPRCLIDAGGDLTIGDAPKDRIGWRVEIAGRNHPQLPILHLANCAVATSGDVEQFLEIEGRRYSHILNPLTGLGLPGGAQATVVAPNCMVADSLASICLVLGLEPSIPILTKYKAEQVHFLLRTASDTRYFTYSEDSIIKEE